MYRCWANSSATWVDQGRRSLLAGHGGKALISRTVRYCG